MEEIVIDHEKSNECLKKGKKEKENYKSNFQVIDIYSDHGRLLAIYVVLLMIKKNHETFSENR